LRCLGFLAHDVSVFDLCIRAIHKQASTFVQFRNDPSKDGEEDILEEKKSLKHHVLVTCTNGVWGVFGI